MPWNFISRMNAKLEDKGATPLHLESGSVYSFKLSKQVWRQNKAYLRLSRTQKLCHCESSRINCSKRDRDQKGKIAFERKT